METEEKQDIVNFLIHCSDYIDIWYDKVIKLIPDKDLGCFLRSCSKHKDIWYSDLKRRGYYDRKNRF